MSSKQKNHSDALRFSLKAVQNIHANIMELIKLAKAMLHEGEVAKHNVNLFSDTRTEKFIIEANNERKNEIVRQIITTLEGLTENFIERDVNISKLSDVSSLSQKRNVLRSALGVSLRRPWLNELKIEDMFKIQPIYTDEFVLTQDANIHVTIDAV